MTKAEVYVRDHLLLQFVFTMFNHPEARIEEVYKEWINWLKYEEKKHGKGSKI